MGWFIPGSKWLFKKRPNPSLNRMSRRRACARASVAG